MLKFAAILYIVIGTTMAGIFATIPMVMAGTGPINGNIFIAFAAAGAIVALPISWYVAKKIDALFTPKGPHAHA